MTTVNLARLRRVRTGVRLTLLLGVLVSITANVLHANPNPISQAVAAWAPVALLLSVELISRVPAHHPAMAFLRLAATITIAGIAAWVSYWHMVGVAVTYGETGLTPYLLPISVDGLIVVASISLIEIGGRIRHHENPPPASAIAPASVDTHTSTAPAPTPALASVDVGPPAALLAQARLVANAHHRATGTTITTTDLAGRMRIPETTAHHLLAHLNHRASPAGTTASKPPPATHNGTPTSVGTAVQEALL
jgi:hypothetical protein